MPTTAQRVAAEFVGTFFLVFAGCGAAVLSAGYVTGAGVHLGIGFTGVALAFGLTVTAMAYALSAFSGGHFNPAVTVGVAVAGRFAWRDVPMYVGTQVAGAVAGAALLYAVCTGSRGFDAVASGFASNGFGDRSPGGYSLVSALIVETVLTAVFVHVILAVTGRQAKPGFAPPAIGLCLVVIHLVSIPVTNTSVNPARSIGPALFAGGDALAQVWLFVVAPVVGAALAGMLHARLLDSPSREHAAATTA